VPCRLCPMPPLLAEHRGDVRALSDATTSNQWRAVWGSAWKRRRRSVLLAVIPGAGRARISRLESDKFVVQPHAVDYLHKPGCPVASPEASTYRRGRRDHGGQGAAIVLERARLIRRRGLRPESPSSATEWSARVSSSPCLGPYQREHLPEARRGMWSKCLHAALRVARDIFLRCRGAHAVGVHCSLRTMARRGTVSNETAWFSLRGCRTTRCSKLTRFTHSFELDEGVWTGRPVIITIKTHANATDGCPEATLTMTVNQVNAHTGS